MNEARRMVQVRKQCEQAKVLAAAQAAERPKRQRHQRVVFEAEKKLKEGEIKVF